MVKRKLRTKKIKISSGMPVSMFLAKPAGKTHYCLYDLCNAISTVFSDFTNISAIYDSPTRKGVRLTESRPFLEVNLNGESYLIDVLLKRMYKKEFFVEKFNMEILSSKSKNDFSKRDKKYYKEEIALESDNFGNALFIMRNFLGVLDDSFATAEMYYELELSKKNEPDTWQELAFEVEAFEVWQKKYFN